MRMGAGTPPAMYVFNTLSHTHLFVLYFVVAMVIPAPLITIAYLELTLCAISYVILELPNNRQRPLPSWVRCVIFATHFMYSSVLKTVSTRLALWLPTIHYLSRKL